MREENTPWSWQFERRHLVMHSPSVMVQTVENKPQADKLHNNGIWQKWDIRPSWKHLILHASHFLTSQANIWLQQGDSQAASGRQLCAFAHLSGSQLIPNDTNHWTQAVCPQRDTWFRSALLTLVWFHQSISRLLLGDSYCQERCLPTQLAGKLNSELLTPDFSQSGRVLWAPDDGKICFTHFVTSAEDWPPGKWNAAR